MLRLLPYMVIYNGLRYKIMKLPTKRRCLILRFCHGLILSMHYSIIVVLVSGIVSEFLNMTFCIQNTDTVSPSPDLFQIHKVLTKFLCIFNYNNILLDVHRKNSTQKHLRQVGLGLITATVSLYQVIVI